MSIDITHGALHPLAAAHPGIRLLLGDSADPALVGSIRQLIPQRQSHGLLLILDSDRSAPHVLRELNALVPLITFLRRVDLRCTVMYDLRTYTVKLQAECLKTTLTMIENLESTGKRQVLQLIDALIERGALKRKV